MYQAYLLAGQECRKLQQVKESCAFYPNTTVTTDIQYKCTAKQRQTLVLRNDMYMEFCELLFIQNDTYVFVLMNIHKGIFISEYNLHYVTKGSLGLQSINVNDLLDFYTLVSYILMDAKSFH